MSKIRICTPVIGKTLEQFLENLRKTQEISDFVELQVDTISHIQPSDVLGIKKAVKRDAIFTCRKKEEGGKFSGSEKEQVDIFQKAIDLRLQHVEIEFKVIKEHTIVCNNHSKIILSYHNLTETPSYWDLNKLIFQMKQSKPDIIKIATRVNEEYEQTKLYRLLTNKPHEEERIIIGMGEKGRMSKILAPLLGSYLTYASTPYCKSVDGEINLNELKELYYQLEAMKS